ncbi:unnamed protein product [Urochloa humidicola]
MSFQPSVELLSTSILSATVNAECPHNKLLHRWFSHVPSMKALLCLLDSALLSDLPHYQPRSIHECSI